MKKNFTLSAGILFLVTILVAGGCNCPADDSKRKPEPEKVIIYLSSVIIDGKKHLGLSDTNGVVVVDTLTTIADWGTKILWKLKDSGGIKKIDKIYPVAKDPRILKTDPKKVFLRKDFKFIVPDDAEEATEKYAIDYTLEDDTKITIDPYIRIPE